MAEYLRDGAAIYEQSFAIIRAEADLARFSAAEEIVAVRMIHASGMVEFEFAVGEPGLFVEMVLPRAEFDDFCATQGVQPTQGPLPEQEQGSAAHEWDWSLRTARERHFRHEP